ncbi:acetyltransferase [Yersinia wautersii]|uniref:Acetyltransferase n=1 Tax=Yersinia wautersii TaxID=1341643 RepID=A0ABM9TD11_9GAMM|nr:acetyltransferase [Yersinia wautersii]
MASTLQSKWCEWGYSRPPLTSNRRQGDKKPCLRLLTNPDDAILNGEDRQRSKASAPRMARLEPTWMYLRRLYDLPVLSVAGTLSITSDRGIKTPVLFFVGYDTRATFSSTKAALAISRCANTRSTVSTTAWVCGSISILTRCPNRFLPRVVRDNVSGMR